MLQRTDDALTATPLAVIICSAWSDRGSCTATRGGWCVTALPIVVNRIARCDVTA